MEIKIDTNSSEPLHKQAEDILRKMITRQEYLKGKLLPPEVQLSQQLCISRNTLRQAINKLVYEGLLLRKKGYGTVVARNGFLSGAKNWVSFSKEMQALGIKVKNFELHVSRKSTNEDVSAFFNITNGDNVMVLERLRGNESAPFVYFISYFNPNIGLTGDESYGTTPLYEILEKEHDIIAKTSKEEISAILADDFIAKKLSMEKDDPVLLRKRLVYDINDNPIEYNIGYYKADSFTYIIECER